MNNCDRCGEPLVKPFTIADTEDGQHWCKLVVCEACYDKHSFYEAQAEIQYNKPDEREYENGGGI